MQHKIFIYIIGMEEMVYLKIMTERRPNTIFSRVHA